MEEKKTGLYGFSLPRNQTAEIAEHGVSVRQSGASGCVVIQFGISGSFKKAASPCLQLNFLLCPGDIICQ
jgi:hypothetical protein